MIDKTDGDYDLTVKLLIEYTEKLSVADSISKYINDGLFMLITHADHLRGVVPSIQNIELKLRIAELQFQVARIDGEIDKAIKVTFRAKAVHERARIQGFPPTRLMCRVECDYG